VDILGTGFLAHQDDVLALIAKPFRRIGVEYALARCRPRRCGQAEGDRPRIESRVETRVQ